MIRKNHTRAVKVTAIKSAIRIQRTAGKACETVNRLKEDLSKLNVSNKENGLVFLYW